MPRRAYIADLQKAQNNILPPGIHNLQQGEDDGQFVFEFAPSADALPEDCITITAMITDLGDYPKSHEYMIFCGEDAPRQYGSALQNIRGTDRKTVWELLDIVSAALSKLSPDHDGDTQMADSQEDILEDDEDDDVYDSDHEAFDMGPTQHTTLYSQPTSGSKSRPIDRAFRARIKSDLIAAKDAGFKVGSLGHLLEGHNAFVSISIRMSKLGISEEAMKAWQVEPTDYLILLIQYPNGYKTNEELQNFESLRLAPNIGMRVCTSKRYKPTLQEAIKAFTVVKKDQRDSITSTDLPAPEDEADENALRETFISRPLNGLLTERLVPILRFRSAGMDWRGAERWYHDTTARMASGATDAVPDQCYEPEPINQALPSIVNADHFTARKAITYSFPLLAMQFTLRHFVRCTDFCLVCHQQLDADLEAIKPYVCDSSLCLYQYMTLGFGPSIEHEIFAQPFVVDLLISFTYSSAHARRLKEFPDGLALMVPPIDATQYQAFCQAVPNYGYYRGAAPQPEPKKEPAKVTSYEVGFDRDRLEIIFHNKPDICPVRRGSWIVLKVEGTLDNTELHCRVKDVNYYPTITIDSPLTMRVQSATDYTSANATSAVVTATVRPPRTITPATTPQWAPASFQVYEQDFEQLDKPGKCLAICKLLDLLPNVKEMQEYLAKHRPADLKHWVERISPAGLSLLRWIIASNRACIMQVDGNEDKAAQERLYGMKGYMQFRFAMGAPDKEQRFDNEVKQTTERLSLKYPTIFAWHGSPLYNWHMIIREGLHFKNADHGRAFGDGVYHAKDATTSSGYSGMYNGQAPGTWPNSVLRISSAIALNEIVNAPREFQSENPYYVVQHLDWIQTRYLFVQCTPVGETVQIGAEVKPTNAHPQDPNLTPKGVSNPVVIPASAIKSSRYNKDGKRSSSVFTSPLKKLKGMGGFGDPILVEGDDDAASVDTDVEDMQILLQEEEEESVKNDSPIKNGKSLALPLISKPKGAETDFEPGKLNFTTLPLMPTPEYAVSSTTKALMKELKNLQKVQDATPLGDLGWYIDADKIENVYQWIVELHSFHVIDKNLPIVADMKKQNVKSIVLEVRFNKDFPFTPPYVRVIRPQFLTRMQGGGGHVVAGGAMCMELLTNTGWSSVSSMESVLMQIRLAIASEPPARLDMHKKGTDYGTGEAAEGYIRACHTHGWVVPPGFKDMAYGSASSSGAGSY